MYSPLLLDHAAHPRNTGPLPGATHVGEARYERCGDRMRLEFLVADGRVREVRGQAFGCGAAVAAASVATELLHGLTVTEARNIDAFQLDRALGGVPRPSATPCHGPSMPCRGPRASHRGSPSTGEAAPDQTPAKRMKEEHHHVNQLP